MASQPVQRDEAGYHLEFLSPSGKEFEGVANGVAVSCPGQCIVSVERVIAPKLEERYEKRKTELAAKGKIREFTVYHGARDARAIQPILEDGFKESYNTTSAHGKGTYFATTYAVSKLYSGKLEDYHVILVCSLATQTMVQGRPGQTLSPKEGDCWVDNTKHPSIFSVPNDHQSVPRYLVQFWEDDDGGRARR